MGRRSRSSSIPLRQACQHAWHGVKAVEFVILITILCYFPRIYKLLTSFCLNSVNLAFTDG